MSVSGVCCFCSPFASFLCQYNSFEVSDFWFVLGVYINLLKYGYLSGRFLNDPKCLNSAEAIKLNLCEIQFSPDNLTSSEQAHPLNSDFTLDYLLSAMTDLQSNSTDLLSDSLTRQNLILVHQDHFDRCNKCLQGKQI